MHSREQPCLDEARLCGSWSENSVHDIEGQNLRYFWQGINWLIQLNNITNQLLLIVFIRKGNTYISKGLLKLVLNKIEDRGVHM